MIPYWQATLIRAAAVSKRWRSRNSAHLSPSYRSFPTVSRRPMDIRVGVHESSQPPRFCLLRSSTESSPLRIITPIRRTCKFTRQLSTLSETREVEERKESNRAAFRATPVIPSILAYIAKIGVGMRPKKSRPSRQRLKGKSGKSNADTFNEIEEQKYFEKSEAQYRLQRNTSDQSLRPRDKNGQSVKKSLSPNQVSENGGVYWLPPPPFSSSVRGDLGERGVSLKGQRVIRRPVKFLGKAGSLSHELPRESKGLAEVAIAGRSNVGKSTLLNALLYGNTDENLSPRQYQRGGTPDRTKLPKGIKAEASSKPGQTKELSFYQLTADVVTENGSLEADKDSGKMSLLLVDLPGYGFAFDKEERTIEWKNLMHHYLLERRSLKRILLLLDARHGFKKTDFDFLGDLQDGLMARTQDKKAKRELPPIQIVLTKCDLVQQTDLARRVVIVRKQLSDFLIREPSSLPVMLVSARAGVGYNNIRKETPMGGVLELQRELASLVPKPRFHGSK